MPPLKDIRDFIPKTAQTNPNNFPTPDYQRYPLMAIGKDGKPLLNDIGQPVVFQSQEDEDAFYNDPANAEHVKFRHVDPENMQDELSRLRAKLAEYEEPKTASKDDKNSVSALAAKPPKPGARLE